jgi:hypothetical protein
METIVPKLREYEDIWDRFTDDITEEFRDALK